MKASSDFTRESLGRVHHHRSGTGSRIYMYENKMADFEIEDIIKMPARGYEFYLRVLKVSLTR